jgi:hypothetical protein
MTTRSKISRIRLAALSLLATTLVIGALIVHSLSANVYYNFNMIRLQTAADIAAIAGAHCLPGQPLAAVQVAVAYAKMNGVKPCEIEFMGVSPDSSTLRIRLRREMPLYIVLFAYQLPSHRIEATAAASVPLPGGHTLSVSFVN